MFPYHGTYPGFFGKPSGHGHLEGLETGREARQVRAQDAFELHEWLFVKGHQAHVPDADALAFQAPADGMDGEGGIVLAAAEAFFVRSGYGYTVLQEGGGGVMVMAADPQDVNGGIQKAPGTGRRK